MSNLFVSWAGSHAQKVGELIKDLFAPFSDQYGVFLSSRDLPSGKLWRSNLVDKLHSADDGLIIFSQEGIKSDWQLHESAVLSARSQNLDIFLFEAPSSMLPLPLQDFQFMHLNYQEMEIWINRIIASRNLKIDGRRKQAFLTDVASTVERYQRTHVTGAQNRWDSAVSYPIAVSAQSGSPYDLSEVIRVARNRLVLVAQNHRFMTDPNGAAHLFRDQIFAKLNEGLSIDIVAMHPNVRPDGADDCDARRVWGFSSGSAHFDDHLKDCWRTFNNWSSKYRKESASLAGKLRIFGAYLLPLSVKIVDPESEDGFAVLSPRLMEQFANGPRPQFIVTRRYERVVFNFYWSSISTSFDNAGWKLSNKIPKKPMYV